MSSPLRATVPAVNAWSAEYLQAQYEAYQQDPASLTPEMRAFFAGFDLALRSTPSGATSAGTGHDAPALAGTAGLSTAEVRNALRLHAGARSLIDAFRRYGHFASTIDPFGRPRQGHPALALAAHGLTEGDLDAQVDTGDFQGLADAPGQSGGGATLRQLHDSLRSVYCSGVGVQVMHIADELARRWLVQRIESSRLRENLTKEQRFAILGSLNRAEQFEKFLQLRYPSDKRFSLEGGETLIPVLERLMTAASEQGAEELMMGMPHRGRLNVLNNILGKSYHQIFTEFEGSWKDDYSDGGGDVKYHKGFSGRFTLANGKTIDCALASNPSHLESVGAVIMGRTRAKQRLRNDTQRTRVVPIVMHGDAAVIGQGIVAELANMGQLPGYKVGGTIHVVVNNQIGFTTIPEDGRSSPYCTDIALQNDSPAFHVNAEDPEAAVLVAQVCMEFRQRFAKDAWIDIVCYRKYGHNEQDEQSYTQPIMAQQIKAKHSPVSVYEARLITEGVISAGGMAQLREKLAKELDAAQADVRSGGKKAPSIDPGGHRWAGYGAAYSFEPVETAISRATLKTVCDALGTTPAGFEVNPKLKKLLADRLALGAGSGPITYADAESVAFGSLLLDGSAVRISGQDCRRGTFSHRHAVLRDVNTGEPFIPLNAMRAIAPVPDDAGKPGPDGKLTQSRLCVYDSPLSEEAVIGFDYGYSLADPRMLIVWEGQFGDFVNGAQVLLDQYLASAEIKWRRWSGLTLLLPHGYEGAGPEHSSCRVERFLQLCADDNMQVVNPSTGAQLFHLLRRQVSPHRNFRKPLVVLTPKGMLRSATSRVEDLLSGTFRELIDDESFDAAKPGFDRKKVTRVVLCSGKVYHELAERRSALGRSDVALVRVEQLYPFHTELFAQIIARYPAKAELVFCQEEPRNAGAFLFLDDLLRTRCGVKSLRYIGRPASATPATGGKDKHKEQQEAILSEAVGPLPGGKPPAPGVTVPAKAPTKA
jgi:2-oxoglutarate dehydrogenase E1 component